MNRIIINEQDLTTNGSQMDVTDVVYVPGFSNVQINSLGEKSCYEIRWTEETEETEQEVKREVKRYYAFSEDEAIKQFNAEHQSIAFDSCKLIEKGSIAEAFTPVFCKSVGDFRKAFGSTPAIFQENQQYPVANAGVPGFISDAIPNFQTTASGTDITPPWFKKGDPDPSYIYAYELLLQGIPVIYERINLYVNDVDAREKTNSNDAKCDITVKDMYGSLINIFKFGESTYEFRWDESGVEKTQLYYATSEQEAISQFVAEYPTITNYTCRLVKKGDYSLTDKNEYNIKYLTTGGYPTFEYNDSSIALDMMTLCRERGDAIALIDHTDNPTRPLNPVQEKSVFSRINQLNINNNIASYGAMYTPYGNYTMQRDYANSTQFMMPASFAYLLSLSTSIKINPNWLAIAGVARGLVPQLNFLHTTEILTNSVAEDYQHDLGDVDDVGISINPITKINPYGYCIWGNRTLKNKNVNTSGFATEFVNLRNLTSDIKKQLYIAAKSLMFEQNTDVLWINFKAMITPLLDRMKSGFGISNYKIIRVDSNDKTKLVAVVRIYPIYAIESFEITVVLSDEETIVE